MRALDVVATTRASFGVYSVPEEVDQLIDGLHQVTDIFAI
jgi:selenocysteine lyase/cysteine desulfurase